MLVKLAQSCEGGGGGAGPPLLQYLPSVAVYTPPQRANALPLFHLYPYVLLLCGLETELDQQHTSIMSVAG